MVSDPPLRRDKIRVLGVWENAYNCDGTLRRGAGQFQSNVANWLLGTFEWGVAGSSGEDGNRDAEPERIDGRR